MSTPLSEPHCACPDCSCPCPPDPAYQRDGKTYCSQACADLHPQGQPCPANDCRCGQGVKLQERTISDSRLDAAVEETFPASDPISP
ncbi:metallothionein family protein [Pseudomonas sp. MRSN 12121]|uniref:metallothionein family protein n=1 Tax=Pseudomonas sp. MRSN 12121 TaxID=1611770 RepID=UPI0009E1E52B|nr:metallothionein family protein [Pseudomonas sp. MRSN 12121]